MKLKDYDVKIVQYSQDKTGDDFSFHIYKDGVKLTEVTNLEDLYSYCIRLEPKIISLISVNDCIRILNQVQKEHLTRDHTKTLNSTVILELSRVTDSQYMITDIL